MCFVCGDADKKRQAIENTECDGNLMPFLTLSQLKADLARESKVTGKKDFRIFKDMMLGSQPNTVSFEIKHELASPQTINITFV